MSKQNQNRDVLWVAAKVNDRESVLRSALNLSFSLGLPWVTWLIWTSPNEEDLRQCLIAVIPFNQSNKTKD